MLNLSIRLFVGFQMLLILTSISNLKNMKPTQARIISLIVAFLVFAEVVIADPVLPASGNKITSKQIDSINTAAFDLVFSDQEKVMDMMRENYPKAWDIKDTNGFLNSLNILGIAFDIKGNLDSSEFYFSKTLELSKLYKNVEIEEKSTNNLGMMNWNKGNLFLAQQYFYEALKMSEIQKNEKRTSVALSNIGLIYQELFMYEKALQFHRRSLAIRRNNPDLKKVVPLSMNNMAICMEHLLKIDSAIILVNEGLQLAREINNKQTEGNLLTTLGNCYYDRGDYQNALKYCLESVQIKNESGNVFNLNKTFNSLCDIYLKLDQPHKALEYALKAKNQILASGHKIDWIVYYQLAKTHFYLGNKELGEAYFERSNTIKDSVFSTSHAHSFAELEVMHESKIQEDNLNKTKIELAEEQLKVQTQNLYLIVLGSGLLIFVILAIGYYKKQKFKKEQFQKELILQDRLAKAEMQNQLNNERMRISKDLHDNIGSQLTLVSSSLDNLSYKVDDVTARSKMLQISAFAKTTMSQLRDSIWALNRNEFTLEDFHLRVLDFINKAKMAYPTVKFISSGEGDLRQKLSPEQGISLLYVIQEILNNSLKYANCSNISYRLVVESNQLNIEVSDNGIGFRKEEIELGNGLINIDTRLKRIKGNYSLKTEQGKGTNFQIQLNI